VILPQDNSTKAHASSVIPPEEKNGQKVPSDLTKSGWFFTSETADAIDAVYLFGTTDTADAGEIVITLSTQGQPGPGAEEAKFDEMYLLVGIGIAAAGAAAYYLKGIRKKP
jgi:hypothetical protein